MQRHSSRRTGRKRIIGKAIVKVELRVADQVIVLRMPTRALLVTLDEWVRSYEYWYWRDPVSKLGHPIMMSPDWYNPEIPSKAGPKLRYFRNRKALTQVSLADLVGTTQANIASMEKGSRVIGKSVAERLAKVLDVDYRVFLY